MEYLVRSKAGIAGAYIPFTHELVADAARCAVFQAICTECDTAIPPEGPSVTFRTPSANPHDHVNYLTTVHMGRCSTAVQRRITKSMKES